MAIFQGPFLLFCLLALGAGLLVSTDGAKSKPYSVPFNRTIFPSDFMFGAGSAAYQSEGGAYIDGKGPSIWDTFTKNHPEKTGNCTGNIADDFYHHYKSDVALMKKIGLDTFRFSLSWSRLLPKGKIKGGVNPLGVKFYNNLIDTLLANGIVPFVTLYHWDLPQPLEDEYGGLLSYKFVDDYRDYVDFAFKTFGDRVKHWCTVNEPYSVSMNGYTIGTFAPGRCSKYMGNCPSGDSSREPYLAAHHLLLGHAAAVKVYREKYQATQKGKIGITIVTNFFKPLTQSPADIKAVYRALDFMFGWYASPLVYGHYPKVMRSIVGDRLPKFTKEQSEMLKGSLDFLGVNYYTMNYASDNPHVNPVNLSYSTDNHVTFSTSRNGVSIGAGTALDWLFVCPEGIKGLMLYIKEKYGNWPIYVTENGIAEYNNDSLPIKDALKDALRIKYFYGHFKYLAEAIKEGVNVKGFYVWSFFDDFEWDVGYEVRYGVIYVDFKNGLKRYLKYSAYWLKNFLLK